MQKITPFLWFDNNLEEAVSFYKNIFPQFKVISQSRMPDLGPNQPGGMVMAEFEIFGQPFKAINGGPYFKFTEAVSFFIECKDQAEVDHYWDTLVQDGGEHSQCGWLKDKFGVSWQVVPTALGELMGDPDPAKAQRVSQAMMSMTKLDISKLEEAHRG